MHPWKLTLIAIACSLAPAAHAGNPEASFDQWNSLRAPDITAIRFADGRVFLEEHDGWPEEKTIRLRTETAAFTESPSRDVMKKFCAAFAPISGRGMIACALAEAAPKEQQLAWVKQGWRQGDFTADEEERIRSRYATTLTREQHNTRMERLLYEDKAIAAKRMLPLVDANAHAIANVRLAFLTNARNAPKLLKTLTATQQRDAGILFDRLRWRMSRGDDDLAELLTQAPKDVPYPDLWWPMRAKAARDAISKRNYKTALAVLENHGDIKGESLADALWMQGWIHLQHHDNAAAAYKEFFKLYTNVFTPVSKARAAYWAARAAKKNGNNDIANEWLLKAVRYPTVFYGQLAHRWLHPDQPTTLPPMPQPSDAEQMRFAEDDLVQVARARGKEGDEKMRDLFLSAIAARTTRDTQFALLATLAHELDGDATAVEIAKIALRNGIVLIDAGWPQIAVPENLRIEPALTLAITRQESEFDPTARSTANARGLMQLLPSTAKQVARKLDMEFRESMLDNPTTNMTLGSSYLGQMIDGFDGSYILGIASYNAGPGSVRKWIAARGTPAKNTEDAIDWIESIPFGETRNYVMRVLENVSVYRTLADGNTPLSIEQDLVR